MKKDKGDYTKKTVYLPCLTFNNGIKYLVRLFLALTKNE